MNQEKSSTLEIKMPILKLKIGMYVSRLDKPWAESSFLFQGFLISNNALIKKLAQECEYVYIDRTKQDNQLINENVADFSPTTEKTEQGFGHLLQRCKEFLGLRKTEPPSEPVYQKTNRLKDIVDLTVKTDSIISPRKQLPYHKEINFAKQTHAHIEHLMHEFTSQVKEGGTIDILIARPTIYDCMASVLRSPDAMVLATRLKNKHKSVWQRSMNDCVLALSLGRYLNLHEDDLITLGLSALLHDIGNLKISRQAIEAAENKIELIKTHTQLGYDILVNCPGELGKIVAEVAYSHHEQLNGFGFPRGLHGEQISAFTRIVSIVDVYNTLTLDTQNRQGMTHYDAITTMLKKSDSQFDETLLNSFNQCIGIYPVGCVVEMSTGELALVVETDPKHKLRPTVLVLTDAEKKPCEKQVIDLAQTMTKNETTFSIKAIVRPEKYGIQV